MNLVRHAEEAEVRHARWAALGLLILSLSSILKFRTRDPLLTLGGAVDDQVLSELAVWGIAFLWLAFRVLKDGSRTILNRPRDLARPVALLGLYTLLIVASSLYSPTGTTAIVRAGQWFVLFGVVAYISSDASPSNSFLDSFWMATRRSLWLFAAAATLITAAVPLWSPFVVDYYGEARYRWFAMHPIPTGGLLGLVVLTLIASSIGNGDPWFDRRWKNVLRLILIGVAVILLAWTKSRGPLFATVAGTTTLILLTPSRRAKRWSAVLVAAIGAVAIAGLLDPVLQSIVLRGQSKELLLSMTGRTELVAAAWPLVQHRFLFGYGYLSARSMFLDLAWGAGEAHNMYFAVLFSQGLTGLVVMGALLFGTARTLWVGVVRRRPEFSRLAWEAAGLLVFLLTLGVVGEEIAGPPGIGSLLLAWIVLLAGGSRFMRFRRTDRFRLGGEGS
jgi:exopolysaccharide production protein ExoQ